MKIQKNIRMNEFGPKFLSLMMISFMVLVCSMSANAADYVYISDNLRVGVRTEPISGVPPIGVVFTGMRLEVHEKEDGYVRITTNKGLTGWIKDIYVTEKPPAIIQLNSFRKKYEALKKEVSEGSNTTVLLEKANIALTEQVDELKVEQQEWTRERATLMASQYRDSSWFKIAGVLVLIILSFLAGIFWYKTQVMKRLGGLRV